MLTNLLQSLIRLSLAQLELVFPKLGRTRDAGWKGRREV
jgi:hypothetical protein